MMQTQEIEVDGNNQQQYLLRELHGASRLLPLFVFGLCRSGE